MVANNFVIRACEDGPDFCMRSPNAVAVARRAGFYGKQAASPPLSPPSAKSGGEAAAEGAPLPARDYLGDAEAGAPMDGEPPFDFTAAFGYEPSDLGDLEVNRYYTGRRLWRVFDLLAPSLALDPAAGHIPTRPAYPFSVRPEKKVSASRLVAIHRDHYEGTPYDLTRGLASGPFGTPNRYAGARKGGVKGAWERAISMHRSLFAFVAVAGRPPAEQGADEQEGGERQQAQQRQQEHEHGDDRKRAGLETVVWFGADTPHASFFSPLLPAVEAVPSALSRANEAVFDPTVSAWWAVNPVKYVMDLNYRYMQPFVRAQPHAQLRLAALASRCGLSGCASTGCAVCPAACLRCPCRRPCCRVRACRCRRRRPCGRRAPRTPPRSSRRRWRPRARSRTRRLARRRWHPWARAWRRTGRRASAGGTTSSGR